MPGSRWSNRKKFAVGMLAIALLALLSVSGAAQEGRKLISGPTPLYPEIAKSLGLKGVVKVQVVIAPDGTVRETKVIGGHPMLVESVKETLKRWKYAPSSSETTTILEFAFHP